MYEFTYIKNLYIYINTIVVDFPGGSLIFTIVVWSLD